MCKSCLNVSLKFVQFADLVVVVVSWPGIAANPAGNCKRFAGSISCFSISMISAVT